VAEYGEYEVPSPTDGWITFTVPDTRYEDAFWELLDKANGVYEANPSLMEIVWSEAQAYFAGDKTAEQAAENIQSRVSLYLAEQ
jgi:ABC-type glycerol-3-phosphate transport system substrate-binding protein